MRFLLRVFVPSSYSSSSSSSSSSPPHNGDNGRTTTTTTTNTSTTTSSDNQSSLSRRLAVQQRRRQQQQPIIVTTIIVITSLLLTTTTTTTTRSPCFATSLSLPTTTTRRQQRLVLPKPPPLLPTTTKPTTTTTTTTTAKSSSSTTTTKPHNLRLITRRIQQCGTNYQKALSLLSTITTNTTTTTTNNKDYENAYIATLSTLSNAHQYSLAIDLYKTHPTERCLAATISICGKCGQLSKALELFHNHHHHHSSSSSSSSRPEPPGVASYNALLSATGRNGDWNATLFYLNQMPRELISRVTCHAVLTAMAQSRRGMEAMTILTNMTRGVYPNVDVGSTTTPDEMSFRLTARAFIRMGCVERAERLLLPRWETEETFDVLVSAYGKVGRWEDVVRLEGLRRGGGGGGGVGETTVAAASLGGSDETRRSGGDGHYFERWNRGMIKRGKGSSAYWELGRFAFHRSLERRRDIIVALQPHRNPIQNGIKMLFFYDHDDDSSKNTTTTTTTAAAAAADDNMNDKTTSKRERIGYLLMINRHRRSSADEKITSKKQHRCSKDTSTLLGLYISPPHRQKKLSSLFLALWCHLCLASQTVTPQTGIINKPLLALVLQHRLGFRPEKKGTMVEIYKRHDYYPDDDDDDDDDDDGIYLYSNMAKSLEGAFGPWDVKRQHIVLMTRRPPLPLAEDQRRQRRRRRMVMLGTRFHSPAAMSNDDDDDRQEWERLINGIVTSRGRFHHDLGGGDDGGLLRHVLLGRQ